MKKFLILCALFGVGFGKNLVLLDPAAVEIAYMLGVEDQIKGIARTEMSKIYPVEKTTKLKSVGSYIKPNIEQIVALEPELVVLSFHSSGVGENLKALNIKSIEFNANSVNDICKNTKILGTHTDTKEKANELCKGLDEAFMGKTALKGKKIISFFSSNPPMAFSSKTLPGDIYARLGMINLASGLPGDTPIVTNEYILEQDPDFIVIVGGDADSFLASNPMLKNIKAVKNNKIISAPMTLLRGSPRISEVIDEIYQKMQ